MKVGIVGLPNVGKSSLFNLLTAGSAKVDLYPFTTIEQNVGVVLVPDERLDRIAQILKPERQPRRTSSSLISPAWSKAQARARDWATSSSDTSARPT